MCCTTWLLPPSECICSGNPKYTNQQLTSFRAMLSLVAALIGKQNTNFVKQHNPTSANLLPKRVVDKGTSMSIDIFSNLILVLVGWRGAFGWYLYYVIRCAFHSSTAQAFLNMQLYIWLHLIPAEPLLFSIILVDYHSRWALSGMKLNIIDFFWINGFYVIHTIWLNTFCIILAVFAVRCKVVLAYFCRDPVPNTRVFVILISSK